MNNSGLTVTSTFADVHVTFEPPNQLMLRGPHQSRYASARALYPSLFRSVTLEVNLSRSAFVPPSRWFFGTNSRSCFHQSIRGSYSVPCDSWRPQTQASLALGVAVTNVANVKTGMFIHVPPE